MRSAIKPWMWASAVLLASGGVAAGLYANAMRPSSAPVAMRETLGAEIAPAYPKDRAPRGEHANAGMMTIVDVTEER